MGQKQKPKNKRDKNLIPLFENLAKEIFKRFDNVEGLTITTWGDFNEGYSLTNRGITILRK